MSAIAANTNVPVSVKCRIGVDDHDSYDELCKNLLYTFFVYPSCKAAKFGFN
jgi:tRNA-dihydrouridine synthase